MKVIHVLRKPCSEPTVAANVLTYGAGAIHIDACRIAISASDRAAYDDNMRCHERYADGRDKLGGYDGGWRADPTSIQNKGARWPANLVLQHLDGCVQEGTKKVSGNRTDTRPEGDGGREDKTQWRFRPTEATRRGYSDPDGTETVAAWNCAPGCPVAALDQQSGVTKSPLTTTLGAGGKGGASRFFKQVKP